MSISVFCVFLSACNGQVVIPELENKTEVSNSTSKTSIISLDTLKAFPTAEGAGASASGGRNGEVVYVTNTNQYGAGSLKSALLDYGNRKRTILFAVGGRFDVSDWNYSRDNGNFTIAAQTANNLGGVHLVSTVGNNGENGSFYLKDSENMIIRYLSSKGGWQSGTTVDQRRIAFATANSTRVIYDHYSSGFSSYIGKLGGFQSTSDSGSKHGDITFQYSLGHEGVTGQNVGFVLGDYWRFLGGTDSENTDLWNKGFGAVDFHHNAFLNMTHRQTGNIYAGETGQYRRVSNYINGFGYRLDSFVGTFSVDYINNIYEETATQSIDLGSLHKLEISYENKQAAGVASAPKMHFSGNRVIKKNGIALIDDKNQWSFVTLKLDEAMREEYSGSPIENLNNGDLIPASDKYKRSEKLTAGKYSISATPPEEVKTFVLANAGAGVRFNDDGSTYNVDEIDKKYINYAINGGEPTFYSDRLGDGGLGDAQRFSFPHYPTVKIDLNKFDRDRNGLPDVWEKKHKVSNANGTKVNWKIQGYTIKNNAGFTNLEIYLAELAGDFHMLAKRK